MTRRTGRAWLVVLGVAFVGGLLAGLPARIALRFAPTELSARLTEIEGTLWRGRARYSLAGDAPLAIAWELAPWSLLLAAPRLSVTLVHPLGDYAGTLVLRGDTAELADGRLRTSLSPLARATGLPPGVLIGSVDAQLSSATLAADGIRTLGCAGSVTGVTVAGDGAPITLGDLALDCTDSPAGPALSITDRGGPLSLQATVGFSAGWRYLVDGTAGARPGAPPGLAQALPLLGRADGPDRVRFRYSGELKPR
jgi:hypothetical protein